ncbi:MAG: hypothetical protein OWQ59_05940, partial [Alicyclobacillaceae bacterium]|nr:hypothetical protein [Alicyclobacillaceae bacterium]
FFGERSTTPPPAFQPTLSLVERVLRKGGKLMDVEVCPRCGGFYRPTRRNLCPNCQREENQLFEKARHYLKQEPQCNVYQLATHLEVHHDVVEDWIREGLLIVRNHPNLTVSCERCGKTALGKYCTACKDALKETFQNAAKTVRDNENQAPRQGFYSR